MGRKAFFTRDEVFQAAEALAAQSEDVTVRALHAYLGGGSFSSIMKHFTEWKATHATAVDAPKTEMPPSIASAFDAVWRTAMGQAVKELTAEREKAAKEVKDADMRVQETLAAVEELENSNNELTEKLEEVSRKLETTESKLTQALNEKSALSAVNVELKERLEKLQKNFEHLQITHEDMQRKHGEELAGQAKQHADEAGRLKVELAKAEAARDSAREEVTKNQERVITEAKDAKEAMAKLEAKLESTNADKEAAIKEAAQLKGLADGFKSQNEQLLARLSDKTDKEKKVKE
ncbi:MAG TPA: DNA-binding protein [Oculatellaceae cyanobacterium]|jgi:chromosome segregation ATPase|nr:DNA-binding protein [Cyanobacteria bacterium SZAS LIN-5]